MDDEQKNIEKQYILENSFTREEYFTMRYDENSKNLAAGMTTGKLVVFDFNKPKESNLFQTIHKLGYFPITSLRWKPLSKSIITLVTSEGKIKQVHSSTGKVLHTLLEEDNPLMCVDYSLDGSYFATGGNDKVVKLYDDNTKTLVSKLVTQNINLPQHTNRIFSVKFSPNNRDLLLSGGWDKNILLYDIRTKSVTNFLFGPHINGDSMDIKGDLLLTVSSEEMDQIQLFDLRKLSKLAVFQMTIDGTDNNSVDNISHLYSCRFNPKNETFCVTGSNKDYLRIYDYKELKAKKKINKVFDISNLSLPSYCCDYNTKGDTLAYGCGTEINFTQMK